MKRKIMLLLVSVILLTGLAACTKNTSFVGVMQDNGLLNPVIAENLPDYKEESLENGNLLRMWSKWDQTEGVFIHDIQITEKDNVVISYHYKNYSFEVPTLPEPITIAQGDELVKKFAENFIPNSKEIVFSNQPAYFSLYDPGVVESWVGVDDNNMIYIIMIDLPTGNVIYYSSEQGSPYEAALAKRNYTMMAAKKNPTVGDNVATGEILALSPLAKYATEGFSMQTDIQPYSITINYKVPSDDTTYSLEELKNLVRITALDAFTLIENLDQIEINLTATVKQDTNPDAKDNYREGSIFAREAIDQLFQVNTLELANSPIRWMESVNGFQANN